LPARAHEIDKKRRNIFDFVFFFVSFACFVGRKKSFQTASKKNIKDVIPN
jgi:hypothetical protein